MTDDLYERYKEALRVGHVAVLRGALQDASEAYRAAAAIAPSRALPHTSLGGVLLRLGHLEEALVEYAAAVARAPHDEGALLGQAEALTTAGQRVDAALALDHVSEIQEAAGRLPEAADTLRRALELEDTPERGRRQRGLLREIRLSAGDAAAEQLLARALRLRDESGAVPVGAVHAPPTVGPIAAPAVDPAIVAARVANESPAHAVTPAPASWMPTGIAWPADGLRDVSEQAAAESPTLAIGEAAETGEPIAGEVFGVAAAESLSAAPEPLVVEAEPEAEPEPEPAILRSAATVVPQSARDLEWPEQDRAPQAREPMSHPIDRVASEPEPIAAAQTAEPEPLPEPALIALAAAAHDQIAPIGVMEGAFDTSAVTGTAGETQHQPTGDELLAAAEAAEQAGDSGTLRSLLVWTARAYAREGRFEAGLDATHRLLQRDPGDVDAHLVLVELYVARDWNGLAADKLALLGRLAELNNDQETRQRVRAVATRAFPDDQRLAAICA